MERRFSLNGPDIDKGACMIGGRPLYDGHHRRLSRSGRRIHRSGGLGRGGPQVFSQHSSHCFFIISGHARFALLAPQDPRWSHPSDRPRSDAYGVHRRRCCLRDNAMVLSLFVAVMDSFVIRKARGSFSAADVEPDVR